jgi:lysozyme family protein
LVEEGVRTMNRRHGYAAYAEMGALTGGMLACGTQLGPLSIATYAVVGALFGAALRDTL